MVIREEAVAAARAEVGGVDGGSNGGGDGGGGDGGGGNGGGDEEAAARVMVGVATVAEAKVVAATEVVTRAVVEMATEARARVPAGTEAVAARVRVSLRVAAGTARVTEWRARVRSHGMRRGR